MSHDLKVLADNREALLLAEIAAWLHMIGKLHKNFLCGDYSMDIKIPEEVKEDFPAVYRLLTTRTPNWTGKVWATLPYKTELRGGGLTIEELIRRHRPPNRKHEGFIQLLQDAHGRGSGTEKGILNRFALDHINSVYLSTALGYETLIKIEDINKAYSPPPQDSLYNFLQNKLDELENKKAKLGFEGWAEFRRGFLYLIKSYFRRTVAETRRPFNDITLFDQTAVTVAFFKAALAEVLLAGWKDPSEEEIEKRYHWRLMQVSLNSFEFWRNSTRISDILARRELVSKALNQVQTLLEVTYPLAFEVYRDENGSFFVIPDILDLPDYSDSKMLLTQHIEEIAKKELAGEAKFHFLPPSQRTRDTLLFGAQITEILPEPAPKPSWVKDQWSETVGDLCPVCGLRPQGPNKKAFDRKVPPVK